MSYNSTSVTGAACSYASLNNYNNRVPGELNMPYVPPTTVSGFYIVPNYAPPTYDALTHGGVPTCAGYFNVMSAYGPTADSCDTQYFKRPCNQ